MRVLSGREESPPVACDLPVDVALESAEEEVPRAVDPVLSDSSSECSAPLSGQDAADACSVRSGASPGAATAVSDSAPGLRSAALPPRLRLGSGMPADDTLFGAPSSGSPQAKRSRGSSSQASETPRIHREIRLAHGGVAYECVDRVTGRVLRTS